MICTLSRSLIAKKWRNIIKMQRIKSFEVDHTKLKKGLYIFKVDGDIITYDLRMVKPNTPPFLENSGIHTFEHLMATYLRNSKN